MNSNVLVLLYKIWRPGPESNRRRRICNQNTAVLSGRSGLIFGKNAPFSRDLIPTSRRLMPPRMRAKCVPNFVIPP